ncbi:MAG TPA: hypothetical protein VLM78_03745 [Anaerolineales bacterium]|nr:hypothetical protein [Anaerolineales bacterium]
MRSARQILLFATLPLADINPPYIFVGHSFSGLLIRQYNFDIPREVT